MILGVQHDHRAVFARDGQHIKQLVVIQLELVVRHVHLERCNAAFDHGGQIMLQGLFVGIRQDEMEPVVDDGLLACPT
ncbi:hypothetical protein D3C71_2060780 [compost metagenome]